MEQNLCLRRFLDAVGLSGTEPLLRLYVEAESAAASAKLVREATK